VISSKVMMSKDRKGCCIYCHMYHSRSGRVTLEFLVDLPVCSFGYFSEVLKLIEDIDNIHYHNCNLYLKVDTPKHNCIYSPHVD